MRVSLLRMAVIVGALALISMLALPVQAADEITGPGTSSSQKEIKKEMTEKQLSTQPGASSTFELGKETELPMRVPDKTEETGHLQNLNAERQVFDPETLEQIRIQDEISSVSF